MPAITLISPPLANSDASAPTGVAEPREAPLIKALIVNGAFPEPVDVIETHISWVILAGEFAYKIKKPIHFQFADLRTLEQRRRACMDEHRLNSRLAPGLYLDVLEITGTAEKPELGGRGPVLEYAVRMRRADQQSLLTEVIERNERTFDVIDDMAEQVARFHLSARVVSPTEMEGSADIIEHDVLSNFDELVPYLTGEEARDTHALRKTARYDIEHLRALFEKRKRNGFVRECHGDMHLGNMFLADGRVIIFDCIDFSHDLRCIDIMNEVAFVVMDLEYRGRPDLASRFLNRWLEWTGDYEGLELLPFYLAYRAVVRAKVEALRSQTCSDQDEACEFREACGRHLRQASGYGHHAKPRLFITFGPPGSGKTTGTQTFIETLPAIRIRSDVERKRMHGLLPDERSGGSIYSDADTEATYVRLKQLAESILSSGFSCVVDATFRSLHFRTVFRLMARRFGVPFHILPFDAPTDELSRRITTRAQQSTDASEATVLVMERQLCLAEPLSSTEQDFVLDPSQPPEVSKGA